MSSPYSGFPGEDFFSPGFTLAANQPGISRKPVPRTSASSAAGSSFLRRPSLPGSINDDAAGPSSQAPHPSPPQALWPASPHVQEDTIGAQLHGGPAAYGQPVSPISTSDEDDLSPRIARRSTSLGHRVSQGAAPAGIRVNAPLPPLPREGHRATDRGLSPPARHRQQKPQRRMQNWPLGAHAFDRHHEDDPRQFPGADPPSNQPAQPRASQAAARPFMHYDDVDLDQGQAAKEYEYGLRATDTRLSGHSGSSGVTAPVWGGYRASWLPEILWCLTSMTVLAVICVVLHLFDQQPLERWPMPITLNTLIAFLVTLCHSALVVPVVEGLSQLRWNWFAMDDRPLADFQAFEDATRGPYGSVKLLFTTTKGRFLSLTAAAVMVIGLVTSPLTQMAIEYPTRLAPGNGQANVFRSERYPPTNNNTTALSSSVLDLRQKQSIQGGIFSPVDATVAHLTPRCGSAECQRSKFNSLAVCVRTQDVTSLLTVSEPLALPDGLSLPGADRARNASLRNGALLVGSPDTYNMNISAASMSQNETVWPSTNGTLSFANQGSLLATAISNFFIIYTNKTQQESSRNSSDVDDYEFRAVEVLMHFCVGTFEVDVAHGLPRTALVSSSTEVHGDDRTGSTLTLTTAADGNTTSYVVDTAYGRLLSNYARSTFTGAYSASMGTSATGYTSTVFGSTSTSDAFGSAMFHSSSSSSGSPRGGDEVMRETIQNITQNVATSLTNTIRSQGVTEPGQALGTETLVSVRWAWLGVLITQVALSVAFLVGIIVQTTALKVRVLKSSALATMFAVSAEQKRLLERDIGRTSAAAARGRADVVDEGHLMAKALDSKGIRGRFCVMGEEGWVMDLGVRNQQV